MTDMIADRVEYYNEMKKQAKRHNRIFRTSTALFGPCIGVALTAGPNEGWHWLVGAIFFMCISLWAIIEARYYETKVTMCFLPEDIRQALLADLHKLK